MARTLTAIILFSLALSSCTRKTVPPRTQIVMDTVCTVNAFDDGTERLYDQIFLRLKEIEAVFSVTDSQSEISRINSAAGKEPCKASAQAIYVIERALLASAASDGSFNPAAGNLISLWGIGSGHEKVPSESEISEAKSHCDQKKIRVTADSVFIEDSLQSLNLGGAAKGYAADECARILSENKVKKAVIDLGGNILVYGKKDGGKPWTVGIKSPLEPQGAPLLKLTTGQTSVVTSGNYERFFIQDVKRYHHILDVGTGRPAEKNMLSATVICPESLAADCLSTALFVLGRERGLELHEELEKCLGIKFGAIYIEENDSSITVTATKNLEGKLTAIAEGTKILFR